MNWSVICAVNNDDLLRRCLLASPAVASAEVKMQKNYRSASLAYNAGLAEAQHDIVVLAHQDMYFPAGWEADLECAVRTLTAKDPNWAVLGCWGVAPSGLRSGHLYCTGNEQVLGQRFDTPVEVRSLDEAVLILRKSSGVRFDEGLGGFHLYGTDICLEAAKQGKTSYAISAFCIHNTNGYRMLPWDFWRAYFYMRKKWRAELPVITPCTEITFSCWPVLWWNVDRAACLALGRHRAGSRVVDPGVLHRNIVELGTRTRTSLA